jgi:uncharacterized RDD family membrane protein YckC
MLGSGTATPSVPAREVVGGGPRPATRPREAARARHVVTVAGFWRRAAAALVDLAVVLPVALALAWVAGRVAGIRLPPSRNAALDYWLDLALAGEPALWGTFGLVTAIGLIYLMVFHATMARTLGMRALKLRVIDAYGEPPSLARAAARTAGYLLGVATLGLGFVWVGFDAEKRGLHDWVAGTYVIRDEGSA